MRPLFLIGSLFFIVLFFICFDCFLTLGSFGFYCVPFRFNSTLVAKFLSFKEPYSFFTSPIDFIILWLLRAFVLIFGSLHVLRKKFRRYKVFFVGLIIFNWGFSLSKLLAFSEIEEQLEFVGIYFSLLWNILAFILVWLIWRLVFISNLIEILISRFYSRSNEDSEQLFTDEIENDDDEDKNRQTALGHTAKILYYCKAQWRWYTLGFLFLVIYAGSRILLPHFTGIVISRIMNHTEDIWRLLDAIKFMGILTVIRTISGGINAGCFEYATTAMNRKMRSDLFRSILYQEIAFFDEVKTGELISRITADCQTMSSLVSANFNVLLRNIVMLVGALGFMFFLSWRLTLVSFIALPIVLFILRAYGFYYEKLSEHSQNSVAEANQVVDETISTMRTVRSFANEKNECTRFDGFLKKTLKINQKKSIAYLSYAWLNECSDSIILVAVLFYGGFLVLNGKLDMASFASFLFYQMLLGENLYFIGSVFSSLMEGVGSSRKVFEYMNREPRIEHSGTLMTQIEGKIEFQDVSFAYPVRFNVDVLQNVSFEINPGETVALVSQEPILYDGSVRYNILYGCKDDVSEESMIQAAKLANVHDFVMEMKHGYDTNCGEKGLQMSGGQKQRIAIARALVRNPKVLLLDEATSALDAENESKIQEALQKCSVGRTTIIIAHRLSTVERADRIFVVDKGHLIQVGNHRSLLEDTDGLYYSLVNKQILTNTENNESI